MGGMEEGGIHAGTASRDLLGIQHDQTVGESLFTKTVTAEDTHFP